jgi:hypothetical protein
MTATTPITITFVDPVFGLTVLSFDGEVVERFALDATGQGVRFHRSMITVAVRGPNRKGYLELGIGLRGKPGGFDAHLDPQQVAGLEPLLAALAVAGVPVERRA